MDPVKAPMSPSTDGPFLMPQSPHLIVTICVVYMIFVLKVGPHYMSKREPYNLRTLLLVYNVLQIALNFLFFIVGFYLLFRYSGYEDAFCVMPFPSDHMLHKREQLLSYGYYALKLLDLVDTVIFVLRKNYRQVTFLHVYHHMLMVLSTYAIFHYVCIGGQMNMLGITNAFVHFLMYLYYFMSALRAAKLPLHWKKLVTQVQLLQFLIIFVQNAYSLLFRPDCPYPKVINFVLVSQSTIMAMLFMNFYYKAYKKKAN